MRGEEEIKMSEQINPKREQNEFNNALGYIQRLDKIFYMIAESKFNNNNKDYINSLRLLFHELSTEMKNEEVTRYKEKLRSLKEELNNLTINRLGIPKNFVDELEDIEIDLRLVYNSSGLQNRKKDDFLDSDEEW